MARPKLKIGDLAVVRNLPYKYGPFKLGDKGIVTKVSGDVVYLAINGEHKNINIYNVKKWRKYTKRNK